MLLPHCLPFGPGRPPARVTPIVERKRRDGGGGTSRAPLASLQCGREKTSRRLWGVAMPPSAVETLRAWLLSALVVHGAVAGNPDAKRLYDDLLSNYNKLVRPVVNTSDVLRVCIKLKLSQLIDVNLKNQIMTTNLWVEQSWYDYKLRWEPKEYGGVQMLHVPSDHIWRPDIVLYNK
ncbi:hypothetical protein NQ317_005014 [Molorchus minor]|uniref:Neurotransmitter-gated ion-channel ligand-binding domain-containing protein n=1 Tax=Molorchus minor TaxID=1323400 RepID=A0ABQ9K3L9_9CUCU|nr:hypothetical protein NQ317_005014 [Molorchus minor]